HPRPRFHHYCRTCREQRPSVSLSVRAASDQIVFASASSSASAGELAAAPRLVISADAGILSRCPALVFARHPRESGTAQAGCRSEHSRSEWPEGRAADAASHLALASLFVLRGGAFARPSGAPRMRRVIQLLLCFCLERAELSHALRAREL